MSDSADWRQDALNNLEQFHGTDPTVKRLYELADLMKKYPHYNGYRIIGPDDKKPQIRADTLLIHLKNGEMVHFEFSN